MISFSDQITVLLLTFNEEPNIARTMAALAWANDILVIDSGSTDLTLDIIRRYPQARVITRPFDTFAEQCNFGLAQISAPWVLSLDADYELSAPLIHEICALPPEAPSAGYRASFVYRMFGQPLTASLYPPRTVLYRREQATYHNEGHGHKVMVNGVVTPLDAPIYHDDRKPLARWLASQQSYARREADHLLATSRQELRWTGRIRLMGWPAPILVFFYTLVWKRCFLDGWSGWLYVLQRTLAEVMIAIEIVDRRLRRANSS